MNELGGILVGVILIAIVGSIYFTPTIYAYHANHKNKEAIFILNLLLGWTVLGWIGALIWSATK